MKAQDLMTKDPETCEASDTLRDVVEIMREEDCGLVPITGGNGEARVIGVVTDRDVALYLGKEDRKPSDVRAEDVMKSDIVRCDPDTDVSEVTRMMEKAQVRRILVCDGPRLVGVISTADVARATGRSEAGRVLEGVSQPGHTQGH
ncbi:MAG: CBS domain-containing protein [Acidobacteria bacterium]|nr:CBS domain-containing protein [Acidobacteriota bacterium]MCA1611442.1 CBS domain-containing protein [Acidobacteriota bacterium]